MRPVFCGKFKYIFLAEIRDVRFREGSINLEFYVYATIGANSEAVVSFIFQNHFKWYVLTFVKEVYTHSTFVDCKTFGALSTVPFFQVIY